MKTLYEMNINESAKVIQISEENLSNGNKYAKGEIEARLLEMGFIEGCDIRVVHKGLFGKEPIAVRINNNNSLISLRKTEASAILINGSVGS